MIFHWHDWTEWKTQEAYIGEYVIGGGQAHVEIQRRTCRKCKKAELNRQVA